MADYILVKEDRDDSGISTITYMRCGTQKELHEVMRKDFAISFNEPAASFADIGDMPWLEVHIDSEHAYLYADSSTLGYGRYIEWEMYHIGEGGKYVLMEADVDNGCVWVGVRGRYDSHAVAHEVMKALYEKSMGELFHDYYEWDPEYSGIAYTFAECGIETMDAGYYLNIVPVDDTNRWNGFEYLG